MGYLPHCDRNCIIVVFLVGYNMKGLLIVFLFLFFILPTKAQTDSISYRPKLKEVLLPASLVTVGLISNATYINRYVQRHAYRYSGGEKLRFDDYFQYLPMTSVFLCSNLGVKPKHNIKERLIIGATAYAIMGALVNGIKYTAKVRRPDNSTFNSFPSGHTATAFMGMEFLWQEYKDDNIWVGIGGYAIATTVGAMRQYNSRRWIGDVIGGAGIGILSTRMAYWLFPYTSQWFSPKSTENKGAQMVLYPIYSSEMAGLGFIVNY